MSKRSWGQTKGMYTGTGGYNRRTIRARISIPRRSASARLRRYGTVLTATRSARGRNYALSNLRTGGLQGIEVKYADYTKSGTAIASSAAAAGAEYDPTTVLCLNGIAQGDTASSRDGNKVNLKKLSIRGQIYFPAREAVVNPPNFPNVFIALVLDTQTNGAQLNSEDVFKNISGVAAQATTPFRNMEFTTRFRVLKEVKVMPTIQAVNSGAANEYGNAGMYKLWNMHVDLKNLLVQYKLTTGNIDAISDNSLHIIAYTELADVSNVAPEIGYNARLRFVG